MRAYDDVKGSLKDFIAEPSDQHEQDFFMRLTNLNPEPGDKKDILKQAAAKLGTDPEQFTGKYEKFKKEIDNHRRENTEKAISPYNIWGQL